ncbi:MAG: hypothetical protein MUF16_20820 [Burkholderiaceae bacterium]|nr:hypothetical protein [Burkholderiaceae bacterium]
MRQSLRPLTTTLIGGVVFLLPLIVVLYVLGQGLALTAHAAQPLVALLPDKSVGGITLASIRAIRSSRPCRRACTARSAARCSSRCWPASTTTS